MSAATVFLWLAAGAMTLTALAHSYLGERELVRPMLQLNSGILTVPLARQVIRFGWHITTALMLACAAAMIVPGTPLLLIAVVGAIWLGSGLIDLIYTRGKHIGGPMISASGVFALLASLL